MTEVEQAPLSWRLKHHRAAARLEALKTTLDQYIDAGSVRIRARLRRDGREIQLVPRILEPPPSDIGLDLGEFLYNERCALDHLAWGLAALHHDPPSTRTEFPIYEASETFKKNGLSKLKDMDQSARDAITKLQPFQSPKPRASPLWWLHELRNRDTHRTLQLLLTSPKGMHLPPGFQGGVEMRIGGLRDGIPMGRIVPPPGAVFTSIPPVEFRPTWVLAEAISTIEPQLVIVVGLEAIASHVGSILEQFETRFTSTS